MLATISRRGSTVRSAYICSACLRHADTPLSHPTIDQSLRISNSFSTSANRLQAEQNSGGAESKEEHKEPTIQARSKEDGIQDKAISKRVRSKKGGIKRFGLRGRDATTPSTQSALSALRESMLLEEEGTVTISKSSSSTSKGTTKKRPKLPKKAPREQSDVQRTVKKTAGDVDHPSTLESTLEAMGLGGSLQKVTKGAPLQPMMLKGRSGIKGSNKGSSLKPKPKSKSKKFTQNSQKDDTPLQNNVPKLVIKRQLSTPSERISEYQALKREQMMLVNGLQAQEYSKVAMRNALVRMIQEGKLSKEDLTPAIEVLRQSLTRPVQSKVPIPEIPLKTTSAWSPIAPMRKSVEGGQPAKTEKPSATKAKPTANTTSLHIRGMTAAEINVVTADDLHLQPIDSGPLEVPSVSYGLERVLFNPGVYHLQDPRSRVFNFDPYLQTIMPASEFDFNALKQYITSSRDNTLISKALEEKKKYTGSTSSMTAALAHFHFLLSSWREINTEVMSRNFPADHKQFTALQRGPVAIFLRWRNGTYAIDADKQFDTANILAMLGKSMEKLLTLPKEGFEKYRKANSGQISEEERNEAEPFHYTTMGDFMMRSQLDAHDPRLPGTGMFDLKTRAVVSIRMDTSKYEDTRGYEIRARHGEWESFEREYYDMIRAAFLKYSLQVRMGRMDGIFVAFHNTDRIFGFQYISLPEMDLALHGTEDLTIGDSEFKLSLDLMNRVLDRATAKFPEKSLRIHFETRKDFMYIFAEPVEEAQIDEIQATNKAQIEEFESKVLGLNKNEVKEENQEDPERTGLEKGTEEEGQAAWEKLRARVEMGMERDESGEAAVDDADDDDDIEKLPTDEELWSQEDRRQVEDILSAAAQSDVAEDEDVDDDDEATDEDEEDNEEDDEDSGEDEDDEKDGEEDLEEESEEDIKEGEEEGENAENAAVLEAGEVGEHLNGATTESLSESEPSEDATSTVNGDTEQSTISMASQESSASVSSKTDDSTETSGPSTASSTDDTENNIHGVPPLGSKTTTKPDGPVFVMTLAIRNKVNGKYVERPENLTEKDKWTVEYALAEVPTEARARTLYEGAKTRRQKTLVKQQDSKENKQNNFYLENLHRLSNEGRQWRETVNEREKDLPKKVLGPSPVVVGERGGQ